MNEIFSVNSEISDSNEYSSTKLFRLPNPSPVLLLYHSTTDCLFNGSAFRAHTQCNLWPSKADHGQAVADNRAAWWRLTRGICRVNYGMDYLRPNSGIPAMPFPASTAYLYCFSMNETSRLLDAKAVVNMQGNDTRWYAQHHHRHYFISVFDKYLAIIQKL